MSSIAEKIRKLDAHAESAAKIGSPKEAAAFRAKARALRKKLPRATSTEKARFHFYARIDDFSINVDSATHGASAFRDAMDAFSHAVNQAKEKRSA